MAVQRAASAGVQQQGWATVPNSVPAAPPLAVATAAVASAAGAPSFALPQRAQPQAPAAQQPSQATKPSTARMRLVRQDPNNRKREACKADRRRVQRWIQKRKSEDNVDLSWGQAEKEEAEFQRRKRQKREQKQKKKRKRAFS